MGRCAKFRRRQLTEAKLLLSRDLQNENVATAQRQTPQAIKAEGLRGLFVLIF